MKLTISYRGKPGHDAAIGRSLLKNFRGSQTSPNKFLIVDIDTEEIEMTVSKFLFLNLQSLHSLLIKIED